MAVDASDHGWVRPRPDGTRERCGGPSRCTKCRYERSVARRCWKAYAQCIKPLRETARECGYALGLHGSLRRDIDLIAAPWSPLAFSAEYLIERLAKTIEGEMGFVAIPEDCPSRKPFGRLGWSLVVGGGTWFDISVMPRIVLEGIG